MSAVQIRLYDMFRKDLLLPDDRAAAFVTAVEEVIEQKEKEVINSNATRDDIRKLEQEIHKLELKIKVDLVRLELKIQQAKNETNKIIFLTGLVQFLGIPGGLIAIVKFMK